MLSTNIPLCPLDDRYARRVDGLRPYFTEPALIQARVEVEIRYLIALSEEPNIRELPKLTDQQRTQLLRLCELNDEEVDRVKAIEEEINHDVKAVEYWLREEFSRRDMGIPPQFIHFGLTSEDVTNLAYGRLIQAALRSSICPTFESVIEALHYFAARHHNIPLLGMTHGQPATPVTVEEQLIVFVERLKPKLKELGEFRMNGKLGGAVGNFFAHTIAYPNVDWRAFRDWFVRSLDLEPLQCTKQINSHDDLARLSHLISEINTILLDLAQDMWLYISRGVFCEKVKAGEVGSSTMPNKVNPLDWENAEGNLGISSTLFDHFARKLPISRMQRDLSDSTVQRWIGVAFGAHFLALTSIKKGLGKLEINHRRLKAELNAHPDVYGEAIQIVMRRFGYEDAYEQLKELTRGKEVTREDLTAFVQRLDQVPDNAKERLLGLLQS